MLSVTEEHAEETHTRHSLSEISLSGDRLTLSCVNVQYVVHRKHFVVITSAEKSVQLVCKIANIYYFYELV